MPDYGPAPGAGGGGGGGGYGSRIASELMARKGQLSDLDPETQARLAKVKEAELMMLDKTMSEQSAQLLENMFGRGIQRSTIAGRVGEQLVASQGIARAGIESSAAQRYIGIQKDISDRAVAEAQVAVQDLSSLRQYKVGMAGVDAENRRTAASLKMAAMETSAKMAIAQGQLELGYGQLDLGYAGLDLDRDKFDWSQTQYWENLKRQDRSLDLQEKGLKNQSRSNWMGVLGGLGSSFLSILPFLSHPSFKAGLTPIEHEELAKALETVKDLPLYNFSYLGEADVHMGVNALEAHRLDDRLSNGLFVKPIDTIYVLVAAIKALTERVEELEHGR
jgi:hypothetical protein